MKFQSILTKSLAAAALTATGLVALNSQNTNDAQAATIVQNDTNVVTINNANSTVAVWDGIENANFTGKELVHGTTWKVVRTAYDVMGNKWYDLGANQWIMAKYTVEGGNAASAQVATPVAPQAQTTVQAPVQKQETAQVQQTKTATPAASQQVSAQPAQAQTKQAPVASAQQTTQVQAPKTNYNYNVQRTYSAPVQQQRTYSYAPAQKQTTQVAQTAQTQATTSYTSNVSGSEAAAKAWIAGRESGGSYSARNGQYIGKYQLSASYLGGDYSAANQERVADNYVKSRYGSWTGAQKFWQTNGWY
ncbi:cell surface protein [Lactobacillus johnsonii]|uniref:aggregation-promoting factor n=1 Tax=Lactobacillus TaxID=1578 RepID=UPI000B3F7A8D|nr:MULTISPECIES: cell surface protein [Lactobacillus]ARW74485.1 cell surface protein [Lactobacillus johnsonii]ARW75931.1 cell surface protein [Lactobacillus johnsonii]NME19871.1 cell surface protein [Lactobacillus johnsonii]PEG77731.1 cell surface protein [Lactobacillus sp. UMNPBX19]